MAVVAADVQALSSELAAVPVGTINIWLGFAAGANDATVFGADHDQAVLLWTAHQVQVSALGGAGAADGVSEQQVGSVRVKYGTGSASAATRDPMSGTRWGQAWQALVRRKVPPAVCQ